MPTPLRFRAWHKKKQRMLPVLSMYFDREKGVNVDMQDGFSELLLPDEVVVMQATSLKDRNGQEIFESDIVRYVELPANLPDSLSAREKAPRPVVFATREVERCCCWSEEVATFFITIPQAGDEEILNAEKAARLEVIGSIHEHPELVTTPAGD